MRKMGVTFLVFFGLSLMVGLTADAALTGTISGTISDTTGQAIPGVQVSVTGTGLPGVRTDYTREDGKYRIVMLPPGQYMVKAELTGFKTTEQKDITVNINENSRIDLKMEVSTFEEVVVVTAEAPVLDTKTTTVGVNINREFTERLPNSDSFQDAFAMGGSTVGGSNPHVAGATSYDNLYLYDGVDTTDPVTHTFSSNLNADAIEEVEVQTGGFSAEYGKAMGGIVNAVTKSGGNEFEGIIRFKYETGSLNAPVKDVETRGDYKVKDHFEPTLSFGGPILKDMLWFFLSYRRSEYKASFDLRESRDPVTKVFTFKSVDQTQLWQYFVGKLTFAPNPSHNLEFSYSADPAIIPYNESILYTKEAQQHWEQGGDRFGLNWTYILSSNLFFDTKFGFFNSYIYVTPEGDVQPGVYPVWDRKAQIHYNIYDSTDKNDRSRWSVSTAGSFIKEGMAGQHEFKAGVDYASLEEKRQFNYTNGKVYNTDWYGTDQETLWQRINYLNPQTEKNKGETLSFFLQDSWEIQPGLTFNPGVRYDRAAYKNKEGKTVHTFDNMIAPRLGAAWDFLKDGKSKVYASFGRYYNTFDLTITSADPGPTAITQTWVYDPTHAGADSEGYYLSSQTGGEESGNLKDPDLKPEYADEFVLGYDQEILPKWSAGIKYINKQTRDIVEDVGYYEDVNGIHLATDVDINDAAAVQNWYDNWGTEKYYITNPKGAKRSYEAVEIHTTARTEKLSAEISYTYSKTKGDTENEQPGGGGLSHFSVYYDTPELCQNIYGPLHWDAPHYLKIYLSYALPWGFSIGTHSWWKSGYTYNRYVDDPYLASYTNTTLPDGRGANRLPDVFFVDLSIQKDFDFGKWGVITGMVDISNLLDNQGVVSRVEDDGADWGTDNGWASPRSVLFQIKYAF